MIRWILWGKQIYDKFSRDEMTVYAAQASFFIIISAFPFIMLLMSLIQFIPSITKSDLLHVITTIVPSTMAMDSVIVTAVDNLYTNSPATVLSLTAIAAIWSASKGMLSIERGLNRVFGTTKKRNYIITRLICIGYTLVFMVICILTLLLLVLGSSIQAVLSRHFPFLAGITGMVISFRTLLLIILALSFAILYTYVPEKKQKFRRHLPGAILSTAGWMAFSFIFSIYFNNFSNFSLMYGSLTAIVLLMLWLYVCICILFLGAELNFFYSGDWLEYRKKDGFSYFNQ